LESAATAQERFLHQNGMRIRRYWTRSNTYKWAFFDFDPRPRHGWVIGHGEKQLSNLINEQFENPIVVFTNSSNINVEKLNLSYEGRPIVRISHRGFLQFYERFGRKNAIRLFLLQIKTPEDEAYLRGLMLQNTEIIPDFLYKNPLLLEKVVGKLTRENRLTAVIMNADAMAETLSTKEGLEGLIQIRPDFKKQITSALVSVMYQLTPDEIDQDFLKQIPSMVRLFRRKEDLRAAIDELQRRVRNGSSEREIHEHIFNNIWLLGDEYLPGNYVADYERILRLDEENYYRLDIVLQRIDSHHDYVIVEFKKPEEKLTGRRSNMEIPLATVTKAVSQALEYMVKAIETEGVLAKAIVLIGGEEEPKWLKGYDYFLHGVRIMTYEQIIKNANKRLEFYCRTSGQGH